jgi:hypothetical protein
MDDVATNQLRGFIERTGSPAPGPFFLNPSNIPRSTVCYDNTPITGGFWLLAKVAGVSTWVPLGPPAGNAGWPEYVVSNQASPIAPYTTVTAAIAAAVADGHTSEATPAVVLVMPGFYFENVVFRVGISVRGFAPGAHAVIRGECSIGDFGFPGIVDIADLEFQPAPFNSTTPVLTLSAGATPVGLRLRAVRMARFLGTPLLEVTKPNTTSVHIDDCEFSSVEDLALPNGRMVNFATTVTIGPITIRDSQLTTAVDTAVAVFTQSPINMVDCEIVGQVAAAPGVFPSLTCILNDCTLTAQDQPAMSLTNTTLVQVTGSTINHSIPFTPSFTFGAVGLSAGTLSISGVTFTDQRTIDPSIDGTPASPIYYSQPHNALTIGTGFGGPIAADTTLDQAWDLVSVDMTGTLADVNIELPLLVQVPRGHRTTVSNLSFGAFNVIVKKQGTNSIDLVPAPAISLAQSERIVLQADQDNNTWLTTST